MKPMRIKVEVFVDLLDPQQWYDTYGKESTPAEVRQAVKEHVGNNVAQSAPFGNGEVDANIDWR